MRRPPLALVLFTAFFSSCVIAEEAKIDLQVYDLREMLTRPKNSPGYDILPSYRDGSETLEASLQAPDIQALIAERLIPADFQDPSTSITESGGKLVVMQTPAVHEKIQAILKRIDVQLNPKLGIQALEISIPPEQAIEWLNQTGLVQSEEKVAQLLKKESGTKLLSSPQVTARDGQIVHTLGGKRLIYRQSSVSGSFLIPENQTAINGVGFEVRPRVDFEQRSVWLDLKFLRSQYPEKFESLTFESPWPTTYTITKTKPAPQPPTRSPREQDKSPKTQSETHDFQLPAGKQRIEIDLPDPQITRYAASVQFPLGRWGLAGLFEGLPDPAAPGVHRPVLLLVRSELILNGETFSPALNPVRPTTAADAKPAPATPAIGVAR